MDGATVKGIDRCEVARRGGDRCGLFGVGASRHATVAVRASVVDLGPDLPRFRAMWMTVEFTNVYDDEEHIRRDRVEVDDPPIDLDDVDEWLEWAEENLRPHTGDGKAASKHAGYFAAITMCASRPELVGREFDWGC